MEVIIESMSIVGFSKINNAFHNQITDYYVDKETDTVTVYLGDSSLCKIGTYSRGVYITNEKNNVTVTISSGEFNKITIQ